MTDPIMIYIAMSGFTMGLLIGGLKNPDGWVFVLGFGWPFFLPMIIGGAIGERLSKKSEASK